MLFQLITFKMNMLYGLALSSWNSKAGPNDDNQRKLESLFRS
jgi:hypothetical protein